MNIHIILISISLLYCSWVSGQTYDFYKRCHDGMSNSTPIEQVKINNCARSLYCDSSTMYLLWDCGTGKGLYHSLRLQDPETPSHVNSVKFLQEEAFISIVAYNAKSRKSTGKIVRGRLGGEIVTIDQVENGIFKFDENEKGSYGKYIQIECTKDALRFPKLQVCFKKAN